MVRRTEDGLSLATIYNTLDAFVRAGLCVRIPPAGSAPAGAADGAESREPGAITGGACRFDADTTQHAHVMLRDGGVRDVPSRFQRELADAVPAALVGRVARELGVPIERVEIRLVAE